jgi:hypothetical protein
VSSCTSVSAPPITPGNGDGPVRVRDDEHARVERAVHAVERRDPLAGARAAHDDRVADAVQVERVHRLPELVQHEVRRVHDVADGPQADGAQPAASHSGLGPTRTPRITSRSSGAQIGVVDGDGDAAAFALRGVPPLPSDTDGPPDVPRRRDGSRRDSTWRHVRSARQRCRAAVQTSPDLPPPRSRARRRSETAGPAGSA